MTISIENEFDYHFDFDEEELIKAVINEALDYIKCPYESNVSVTITNNDGIHVINKEYRNIDKPTDVLSFPMINYETPGDFDFLEDENAFDPESGELLLGDIVISTEKVISQAQDYGHTERRELAFLVAHSMFHLFGYDHMTDEEAKLMEGKQEELLHKMGITR